MTQLPEPATSPPIALIGEVRPHRRPRPVRIRRPAAISVLVHALLLALLIAWPLLLWPSRKEPDEVLPASVAMVFEPPKDSARSAPEPSPMATLPVPPSPPAPPAPRPAPAQPAARPAPAPPHPAEPLRPVPATTPPAEPSVPPPTKMATLPMPLRPPRVTPQEPAPRPQPRPRPMPRQPPSDFPAPMNFSFGTPRAQPRAAQQPTPATYGPAARGPVSFGEFARVTSGKVDPSWMSLLQAWWERHGYYPPQAAANGEDGHVGIQIVVDRYGRVNELELLSRSGSQWLDMAAQGVFRGAKLPPLPPDTTDPQITVELTINYILERR